MDRNIARRAGFAVLLALVASLLLPTFAFANIRSFGAVKKNSTWGIDADVTCYYTTYKSGSIGYAYISKTGVSMVRHGRSFPYQCKLGCKVFAPGYTSGTEQYSGAIGVSAPSIGGTTKEYTYVPPKRFNVLNGNISTLYVKAFVWAKDGIGHLYSSYWDTGWIYKSLDGIL